ncbi:MAG TPA: indole-3-glycerol phosphate synthase TrpC [Usitatibacter sp.]|nr:indole-3-glycerol phosphate synthase TrpC [Usitatibacter sp.]
MSDLLTRILAVKRGEIEEAKASVPLRDLERLAAHASPPRGFESALRRTIAAGGPAVIAEIKRASPSKGLIRAELDPALIAASYQANGAACLSVLTDREFFGGSAEDLRAARGACTLPVLRKDFMIDAYQVYQARAWGADCILLIMDAAPDQELHHLARLARALAMDVLVECHEASQLDRALGLDSPLIGINNRNLRTFETRLETTLALAGRVPPDRLLIAESGIETRQDVARLKEFGVGAYLVGSAFMGAADPGKELSRVFFEPLQGCC